MHRRSVVVTFSIFTIFMLAGCAAPTEEVLPSPIPTNTPLPTDTPVPPTATLEPTPTIEEQEPWLPVAELPEPLAGALVRCPDQPDSFYVVGGIMRRGDNSAALYQYDILNASWQQLQDLPMPMRGIAVACYEGKIFVAGGTDLQNIYQNLYIYDIVTDAWSDGPAMPDVVAGGALVTWEGKLYHVGGTRDFGSAVARVDVYDIASGTWTAGGGAPMAVGVFGFASAQAGQFLYVVGDRYTQRYDLSANTWEMGPTFTSQRAFSGLTVTETALYVMGGDVDDGSDIFHSTVLIEVLDLSAWPAGEWVDLGIALPVSNLLPATTCTETLTGGEIWDVGGGFDAARITADVYYLPVEEGCP